MILAVRHIVKSFGAVRAVASVSFDVRRGTTTGLLGRNGAGKTTSLRIGRRGAVLGGVAGAGVKVFGDAAD